MRALFRGEITAEETRERLGLPTVEELARLESERRDKLTILRHQYQLDEEPKRVNDALRFLQQNNWTSDEEMERFSAAGRVLLTAAIPTKQPVNYTEILDYAKEHSLDDLRQQAKVILETPPPPAAETKPAPDQAPNTDAPDTSTGTTDLDQSVGRPDETRTQADAAVNTETKQPAAEREQIDAVANNLRAELEDKKLQLADNELNALASYLVDHERTSPEDVLNLASALQVIRETNPAAAFEDIAEQALTYLTEPSPPAVSQTATVPEAPAQQAPAAPDASAATVASEVGSPPDPDQTSSTKKAAEVKEPSASTEATESSEAQVAAAEQADVFGGFHHLSPFAERSIGMRSISYFLLFLSRIS